MNWNPTRLAMTSIMLWAQLATAGPGALEISETCAVHTGCFTGDSAGYPVTIDATTPGSSFVVTSDLTLPDANTTGIHVLTDNVRIDLGGFTIEGVTTCTGSPNSCSNTGTGRAVDALSQRGVEVSNGAVRGAGDRCVGLGDAGRVHAVRVEQCGGPGIWVGDLSVVSESSAQRATVYGLRAGSGSVISKVSLSLTAGDGAFIDNSSSISNSVSRDNNGDGIVMDTASTAEDCVAYDNSDNGFIVNGNGVIRGSNAYLNDDSGILLGAAGTAVHNGSSANGDHGIQCGSIACNVQGNSLRGNNGWGFFANDATSRYSDNVTHGNTLGAVSGGTDLGGNLLN